mmetsp:Transcript_45491/g.75565  ORF Transcript_45491/g.75565 Transcript_45491/m.75565 type:complete len:200 (-) Transcript_45491:1025-1624(-)
MHMLMSCAGLSASANSCASLGEVCAITIISVALISCSSLLSYLTASFSVANKPLPMMRFITSGFLLPAGLLSLGNLNKSAANTFSVLRNSGESTGALRMIFTNKSMPSSDDNNNAVSGFAAKLCNTDADANRTLSPLSGSLYSVSSNCKPPFITNDSPLPGKAHRLHNTPIEPSTTSRILRYSSIPSVIAFTPCGPTAA